MVLHFARALQAPPGADIVCARVSPSDFDLVATVDALGVFRFTQLGGAQRRERSPSEGTFNLVRVSGSGNHEPVVRAWTQFEWLPLQAGGILLSQEGSPKLLFTRLLVAGEGSALVYHVGSLTGAPARGSKCEPGSSLPRRACRSFCA